MKLQYLFLPVILWCFALSIMYFIPPTSLVTVLLLIFILSTAVYTSIRAFNTTKLPIIVAGGLFLFLVSSIIAGFSLMNVLLIVAITTLLSILLR